MIVELAIIFVPFILFFGLYCTSDPLSRKFMDDLTEREKDG